MLHRTALPSPVGTLTLVASDAGLVAVVERRLLALLLEMAPAHPEAMARELDLPLGVVGRELVLLEHRGLVARFADGGRVLTERGAAIVATLF